jgi:hypothetical protein
MALSLAQVVAERTDALRVLEEAYDARVGSCGDRAVLLESVVEMARAEGFHGSLELAAGVLRFSGRFQVTRGPAGEWQIVRRTTALVVIEPREIALVPPNHGGQPLRRVA